MAKAMRYPGDSLAGSFLRVLNDWELAAAEGVIHTKHGFLSFSQPGQLLSRRSSVQMVIATGFDDTAFKALHECCRFTDAQPISRLQINFSISVHLYILRPRLKPACIHTAECPSTTDAKPNTYSHMKLCMSLLGITATLMFSKLPNDPPANQVGHPSKWAPLSLLVVRNMPYSSGYAPLALNPHMSYGTASILDERAMLISRMDVLFYVGAILWPLQNSLFRTHVLWLTRSIGRSSYDPQKVRKVPRWSRTTIQKKAALLPAGPQELPHIPSIATVSYTSSRSGHDMELVINREHQNRPCYIMILISVAPKQGPHIGNCSGL